MIPAPFKVVLDANVLVPFTLRDVLLHAAARGFYQLFWSDQILAETRRTLVEKLSMSEEQANRLLHAMTDAFEESLVTDYEALVPVMRNDEKDRHVTAAAVKAGAQVIVSANLRDFQDLPEGIEAQSPSDFLENLFDLDPEGMIALIRDAASDLDRPPRTFEEYLGGLERSVPAFVATVRSHLCEG